MRPIKLFSLTFLLIGSLLSMACVAQEPPIHQDGRVLTFESYDQAVLQALDKVTGRISPISLNVGDVTRFGTLNISVRSCQKTPPTEQPESAVFIEVWEKDRDADESHWVFSGWMFASSPALSAMDHAIYDVWVIDCQQRIEQSDTPE